MWAKKGFEIASQQFELGIPVPAIINKQQGGNLTLTDSKSVIKISGTDFSLEFSKTKGTFSKIERSGEDLLRDNGGPVLHLWRAPHQKDDMWAYENWNKYGLQNITWVVNDIKSTQTAPNVVQINVDLTGTGKQNFTVHHKATYTINGKGLITALNDVDFSDPKLVLARLGVRILLNKSFDKFDYLGRGPMENYADRKSGFDVGHYAGSVKEQLTPYEKPMEAGNHEDVRWANVSSAGGVGLSVRKIDSLIQVAALPYTDEEMEPVEYKIDLPKSKGTALCISSKTLGVGSNGCGPRPLERYWVKAKPDTFSYQIQLFKNK